MLILTKIIPFIFVFIYSLLISIRNESSTPDTRSYIRLFDDINSGIFIDEGSVEIGFLYIFKILAIQPYFEIVFFLIPFLIITSLYKLIPNAVSRYKIFILFLIILSPFSYGMSANILRQGVAFGVLILIYIYFRRSKFFPFVLIIPGLFHQSAFLFSIVIYFSRRIGLKYCLIISLVMPFFAFLGFMNYIDVIHEFIGNVKLTNYYLNSSNQDYKLGFRFEFFLINLPIIFLAIKKIYTDWGTGVGSGNDEVKSLLSIYFLFNSVAWFFINLPFNDRFFYYSWSLLPIVMVSGVIYFKTKKIYLGFTFLFMIFLLFYLIILK